MTGPVVVLGAGGHAKVVVDALLASGVRVVACLDRAPERWETSVLGVPVVGGDDRLPSLGGTDLLLANGVGSVGGVAARRDVFERFKRSGYTFVTVRHPSAIVGADVQLGEGVQLMAGSVVQPGCALGADTIVNTAASVDHDCRLGAHVHVAPGATLAGEVTVEEGTHIGLGASVRQCVRIGRNCVVAAGAVVIDDVADGLVVAGVPAAPLRTAAARSDAGHAA